MGSVFVDDERFKVTHCCSCGVAFAMTKDTYERRLKDRNYFFCPYGHQQHFTGPSKEQILQREIEKKQEMLDAANARALREAEEKARIGRAHMKMRDRVMNGVCPCCNRTFQNLMQHMRSEHPDFNEKKTMLSLRTHFGMSQTDVAKEAGVNSSYVSMYERGLAPPKWAAQVLDAWVQRQTEKEA